MAPMRMTKLWFSLACLLPILAVAACSPGRGSTEERAEIVRPQASNDRAAAPANAQPFTVLLDTTKGPIHIEVHPEWAPLGAARFRELVEGGYYTDVAFFRVVQGFMAQIGIHGDPAVNNRWRENSFPDDPVTQSNTRGMLSFATRGPNTRTTQFFINFVDNNNLDGMGFAPFARVREADMAIVDTLYNGYGEGAPRGNGPDQGQMHSVGNTYLRANFPNLDYVRSARIVPN